MKWAWRLHREWKERARRAEAEVERSRQELEHTREHVVAPMARWRNQNHFAVLIENSLLDRRIK